ncbi:MAG: hypothetical protein WDZ88_03065 [Candidatus Paceibacterota bacterium]
MSKLHKQTTKLIARIAENLPEMDSDIIQRWIDNPKRLQKFLRKLCMPEKEIPLNTIDLGAPPRLPFDGVEVAQHVGKGIVEIELRSDDNLYIGGKKVLLYLSELQIGNKKIEGHKLRQELEESKREVLLNANVSDYLYHHPELFPEHWKKDKIGETLYIFFWGSIFVSPMHDFLYVPVLFWRDGGLCRDTRFLEDGWHRQDPSASVA